MKEAETNLRTIFDKFKKVDDANVGYINVSQFCTILRAATGERKNLYDEMKIIHTR